MTIILDEVGLNQSSDVGATTVLCSWCGESIDLEGRDLALSMCQSCQAKMIAEFQKARQQLTSAQYRGDR